MNLTDVKKLTNKQLFKHLGFSAKGVKNTPEGLHEALKNMKPPERERARLLEELSKRMNEKPLKMKTRFNVPKDIYEYFRFQLGNEKQEHFYAMYLDGKYHYMCEEMVGKGTRDHLVVRPCDVFRTAIQEAAAFVVAAHNHTSSGEVTPSQDDINFTQCLVKTGAQLGIPVADHIIIGRDGFFSMRSHNLM